MVVLTKASLDETFTVHREAVRQSSFPPPKSGGREKKTFLHGFFLPFSLILTTLRHQTIGLSYLKITVVRTLIVGLLAALVLHGSSPDKNKNQRKDKQAEGHNFYIDLDKKKSPKLSIVRDDRPAVGGVPSAGAAQPAAAAAASSNNHQPTAQPTAAPPGDDQPAVASHPIIMFLRSGWAWIVWFVGIVSAVEGVVVFFSRRFDDWLGYWVAPLARVRPEDSFPKAPKVAIDIKWLFKKLKRRVRGYVVFGAGIPLIACFNLIPGWAGNVLFSAGLTIWGWYWLAVFTAAKSAHAWADDGVAPSPLLIREIRDRSAAIRWLSPIRLYGRLWGWITKSVNSPAQMFERNPAPFFGMALARCILSLPGLYLLARPVIPVAASRLIAESDPQERFSL